MAFNHEQHQSKCETKQIDGRTFYIFNKNLFRKGFLYKDFDFKQIETQNIKPTAEERDMFLTTYNRHAKEGGDSSEESPELMRAFFKRDSGAELSLGDKVYVASGELQQAFGPVINFTDGGQTVCFKPTNIEGFEDPINLDRSLVVKYFEKGDRVRVVEGKYIGEVGIVVHVDDENVSVPRVKLERTDIEVSLSTNILKARSDRDADDIKVVSQRRKKGL